MPVDSVAIGPGQNGIAGELGVIVADDHLRLAALDDNLIEFAGYTTARQGRVGNQGQALPGAVVDHAENTQPASVGQLIRYEIQRLALFRCHGQEHRRTRADGALAATAAPYVELLLAIHTEEALVVHHVPSRLSSTCKRR